MWKMTTKARRAARGGMGAGTESWSRVADSAWRKSRLTFDASTCQAFAVPRHPSREETERERQRGQGTREEHQHGQLRPLLASLLLPIERPTSVRHLTAERARCNFTSSFTRT